MIPFFSQVILAHRLDPCEYGVLNPRVVGRAPWP